MDEYSEALTNWLMSIGPKTPPPEYTPDEDEEYGD